MKETIIILGAGVMQGPVIKIAKELNYNTIALDASSRAPCIHLADRFEQIDLKDKEGIEDFARSIQGSAKRLGIMTAGTDFSASVAWVSQRLGLPGIPYEAALDASDKSRMRKRFKLANLPSPDFFTITEKDIPGSIPFPFPVVIKPVDNMGSRGCRRADSIEEFHEAAVKAIAFSRSGCAIVEEFMEGLEFSVDAIHYQGEITICGLADRHIFFPPYFIEMGHTMPTIIDKDKQDAILDTFCAGIHALNLAGKENAGAAKGDIKLTSKGPMLGEIAARLSGGYMSGWTYPYSSGALPIKAAILIAMGEKPQGLVPVKDWTCAERAFISIPGTVKKITGIKSENGEVKKSDYVNDIFLRIAEGDKVSFPENNVTKCGNIIASAQNREDAITAAQKMAKSILIRLDSSDAQTSVFLKDANKVFPPDAFLLTEAMKAALEEIPESCISIEPEQASSCFIYPFPAFQASGLRDYMDRTVDEALDAVRLLTGFPLPVMQPFENAENETRLGRSFWAALIRGSYQGAVYLLESMGAEIDKDKDKE
ncbi:MAG: ATP-grasp domain-containing protein [Treponema sp.]|nr:ATP-grasp domain-containing protein [Treponema sp.]